VVITIDHFQGSQKEQKRKVHNSQISMVNKRGGGALVAKEATGVCKPDFKTYMELQRKD
jgi:hypothetical protein